MGWIDELGQNEKDNNIKPEIEKPKEKFSFDFSEEKDIGKEIYTIFGMKGSGKTTLALSLPGKIMSLSFDGKTTIVKNNFYNNDDRIKVFNAVRYYNENPEKVLDTSALTYEYIEALLNEVASKEKPDYILFDCAEVMTSICEMVMRKRNNVSAYGGVVNKNIWKERKSLLTSIHKTALKYAQKGVIYTLYVAKDEIIKEGDFVKKEDVPSWTGIILYETDFVLKTEIEFDRTKGKICMVKVCSSKNDKKLKTGSIIDVTDFKNKLMEA